MVEACSSGSTRGTCVLSKDAPESTRPAAVALVVWRDGSFGEATVRVGQPNGAWANRQLTFAEADPARDRWVTIGLTVASLVDQAQTERPPVAVSAPPPVQPAPPPRRADSAPPPSREVEPRNAQLHVGAGGLIGNGWDSSGAMFGGWATAALSVWERRLVALGGVSLAFSSGPGLPDGSRGTSRWLAADIGLGPLVRLAPFTVFFAPELALQTVHVDWGNEGGRSDQELQLKLAAGATWEASRHWGLTLRGATRLLPFDAPSSDATRARRSGLSGELLAGIELVP